MTAPQPSSSSSSTVQDSLRPDHTLAPPESGMRCPRRMGRVYAIASPGRARLPPGRAPQAKATPARPSASTAVRGPPPRQQQGNQEQAQRHRRGKGGQLRRHRRIRGEQQAPFRTVPAWTCVKSWPTALNEQPRQAQHDNDEQQASRDQGDRANAEVTGERQQVVEHLARPARRGGKLGEQTRPGTDRRRRGRPATGGHGRSEPPPAARPACRAVAGDPVGAPGACRTHRAPRRASASATAASPSSAGRGCEEPRRRRAGRRPATGSRQRIGRRRSEQPPGWPAAAAKRRTPPAVARHKPTRRRSSQREAMLGHVPLRPGRVHAAITRSTRRSHRSSATTVTSAVIAADHRSGPPPGVDQQLLDLGGGDRRPFGHRRAPPRIAGVEDQRLDAADPQAPGAARAAGDPVRDRRDLRRAWAAAGCPLSPAITRQVETTRTRADRGLPLHDSSSLLLFGEATTVPEVVQLKGLPRADRPALVRSPRRLPTDGGSFLPRRRRRSRVESAHPNMKPKH